jgi:hypothetical protein
MNLVELSHRELTLLLFALERDEDGNCASTDSGPPSCEDACPIVERLDEALRSESIPHNQKLARHLREHLREAMVETGVLELMSKVGFNHERLLSVQEQTQLQESNKKLAGWSCEVNLSAEDRRALRQAVSRLPGSAWLSMPRVLWRLRRKLKSQSGKV